jgi:hypothetical protein
LAAVFQPSRDRLSKTPLKSGGFQPPSAGLPESRSFANFLNRLSLKRIEEDYAGLF